MADHDADVAAVPSTEEAEATDTDGAAPDVTPSAAELGIELSGDPDDDRDVLLRLLAAARHDAATEADHALRALAELDNVRKRAIRDRTQTIELATERLVTQLLAVLDSFDAGLSAAEGEPTVREGFEAVRDQLVGILAGEGLARVPAVGEVFDPTVHEAVSVLGEGNPLVVLHEMRPGWVLGSKVVRPATVVVGPAPGADGEETAG